MTGHFDLATVTFWVSLGTILYVYFGYPLLLRVWRRVGGWPVNKQYMEPTVSLVIAMHNESRNVYARLWNCLELDYPRSKVQVIVSLDAPTDGTEDILRGYADQGVEIVYSSVRRGKAEALNRGMAIAKGEIVVFADARQRFDKVAIRELVANFADSSVGAVSGELVLLDENGKESSEGAGLYWRYEKHIRGMESQIHSVPGATGAIYAIRRSLFKPLPQETILDDVLVPMRIVLGGKRAIFDPTARAFDFARLSPEEEYSRKKRTLMGNYQLFVEMPELLLPWRNPIFLQLVSHKLGRLLVPYCLVALFVSNLFLNAGFYRVVFVSQVIWYLMALFGWRASTRGETRPEPLDAAREPEEL